MPPKPTLPIDVFPAWARFNDVDFINVELCETDGKGIGLVTVTGSDLTKIPVAEGEVNDKDLQHGKAEALLRIPHDLVLSASTVEDYAKVDQNFRQLMDSVGHNSTRGNILLYLLAHLVLSGRDASSPRGPASTPWTEYLKFLPRDVPVPTMWSEVERALLQGTSLELRNRSDF
ncbi:hypothetical protein NXS19_003562 [Fusarium pseudograminearum]|nr:hypothetical protein NXS19_003562 [Fusarium pseudograminearum]